MLETSRRHLDHPDAANPTRLMIGGSQNKHEQVACKQQLTQVCLLIMRLFSLFGFLTFKLGNAKACRVAMAAGLKQPSARELRTITGHTEKQIIKRRI